MKLGMEDDASAEDYRRRIEAMLADTELPTLVSDYLAPEGPFAAVSFDTVGVNDPWRIREDDALAVSFLDTPIRPSAFREIVRQTPTIEASLMRISPGLCLWELKDSDPTFVAASELWALLKAIGGLGTTRVSKLLARKRPHLIPILDSRVQEFYGDTERFWMPLARALDDLDLRERIRALAPSYPEATLSTLRILDIAVWSHQRGVPPGTMADDDDIE